MKTVTLTEAQWSLILGHMHADIELHLTEGDVDEDTIVQYEDIVLQIEAQLDL